MVKGEDLTVAHTLKSMYDHDCIEIHDRQGRRFRISCDVIMKALKKLNFDETKLRVHTYLSIAE